MFLISEEWNINSMYCRQDFVALFQRCQDPHLFLKPGKNQNINFIAMQFLLSLENISIKSVRIFMVWFSLFWNN